MPPQPLNCAIPIRAADAPLADHGKTLAAHGIATVALNENGEVVQYRPDGSSELLESRG